jgi:Putative beta barrel porin-7 (BBP7)
MHKNGKVYPACDAGKSKPNSKKSEGWQKMKREKLLASGAWLLMVSAIVAQSPVDGGKVPSPLSPYGQIGSAVIKKEQGTNEKKDLELPAMEVDKVPLGAIPREETAPLYPRFFLGGEYLAWKLNNTTVNPIVFNVPIGIVGAPIAIDNGSTQNAFIAYASLTPQSQASLSQNGVINYGMENGMRFTGGLALEQDTGLSVLLNAIVIPTASYNLSSNTSFNRVPINFQTGLNSQVALGGTAGSINANTEVANIPIVVPRNIASQVYASANNFVGGGEVDLKGRDLIFGDVLFSGLLGFRYFQFNESLGVNSIYNISQISVNPPNESPDQQQNLESNFSNIQSIQSVSSDNIKVYNDFLGPQIGINSNYNFKRVTFDCNGKLGIGVQHQVVTINSSITQSFKNIDGTTPTPKTSSGGLLFSPYDVGRHSRNQFGLIPELNLKLGYRLFDRMKITAGYDFLLMANVLRASNQTQLIPYTTQSNFSGLAAQQQTSSQTIQIPAFTFDNSNLIINGLNVGMQLDF